MGMVGCKWSYGNEMVGCLLGWLQVVCANTRACECGTLMGAAPTAAGAIMLDLGLISFST